MALRTQPDDDIGFARILDGLPDAVVVHQRGRIVFANAAAARLAHASNGNCLVGLDVDGLIAPEDRAFIADRVQQVYAGVATPLAEIELVALDGSRVAVEVAAAPFLWKGRPAAETVIRDIRERKRVEEAAHSWQKRLELAQEAGLRIGLWDWDVVANTVTWSDETYRQFGFARETFSGRVEDAVERLHPDDRSRVEEAIQKVLDGKTKEYAAQYRVVRPDETICWIDAHGVIVRNGSERMLGVGVDITDLKNTAQSLKESEERYLLLLNSSAEAIHGLDLEGNCTFCNPACARLLGHPRAEDLLGKNMHALMHHTRPDGTPYPVQECDIYVAVREGRASHVSNEALWRADGTSFAAEYWSYPMYKGGELVGAVVTFLDISDRKQAEEQLRRSEQKYRQLVEKATYGMFWSKPDGTLLDVNPAMVTMLGYGSRDELLQKNLNHDIYKDESTRTTILESYGPSGKVEGVEANWRRKDGKTVVVRLSGHLIREKNGSIDHYEVIAEDITERRSLEEQLQHAMKMEAVGRLAGGVAHDFNNILGVVIGYSDLVLADPSFGDKARQRIGEIKKAGTRAVELTRQLLAFSRRQMLEPKVLDLNSTIRNIDKILSRLLGEDVLLEFHLQPDVKPIKADPTQIEQVVVNLAVNARDAMPKGGRLLVETANVFLDKRAVPGRPGMEGAYVMLAVSDTGCGMSDDVKARVFEPFFTTKDKEKGTGLGLSTVYGIIEQSGGHVEVYSELGMGTTFKVYLPVASEAVPANAGEEHTQSLAVGTETILLVEDEDALRELNRDLLVEMGYKVITACNGAEAIGLAEAFQQRVHLLLTDVVMPGINGRDLAHRLTVTLPGLKVLYMSGYTDNAVLQRDIVQPGTAFLQKPFSQELLGRKVREVLDGGGSAA